MQFPRINAAINLTLLYYNKHQIVNGVGILSGFMQPVKYVFNDQELPSWDQLVLNSHIQMEDEIKQIINLNYPHVQSIVFEDLRERLSDIRIKSLNKQWITKIADENNKEELLRIATKHPNGFAVTINKDFLPSYFEIVENAISNFKRIINKYLHLYDTDKLPKGYTLPTYIPNSATIIGKENTAKLKVSITVEELTVLFRLLKECKMIDANFQDIHTFIADNFTTDSTENISKKNVAKLWSSKNPNVLTFLIRKFTDLGKKAASM